VQMAVMDEESEVRVACSCGLGEWRWVEKAISSDVGLQV